MGVKHGRVVFTHKGATFLVRRLQRLTVRSAMHRALCQYKIGDYPLVEALPQFVSSSIIGGTVTSQMSCSLWYVARCTVRRWASDSVEVFFGKGYVKPL